MYEFAVTPAVTQIRRRGVEISEVTAGSLGAELELEPGDRIIRVNGRTVRDYLDFRFQASGETDLVVDIRKRNRESLEDMSALAGLGQVVNRPAGDDFAPMPDER